MAARSATLADDLALAHAVTAAACTVPGVAALSRGRGVGAATYGPGETVYGVTLTRQDDVLRCGIHVVVRYPDAADLLAVAARVRAAARERIAALTGERLPRVDVTIEGLVIGEERP